MKRYIIAYPETTDTDDEILKYRVNTKPLVLDANVLEHDLDADVLIMVFGQCPPMDSFDKAINKIWREDNLDEIYVDNRDDNTTTVIAEILYIMSFPIVEPIGEVDPIEGMLAAALATGINCIKNWAPDPTNSLSEELQWAKFVKENENNIIKSYRESKS